MRANRLLLTAWLAGGLGLLVAGAVAHAQEPARLRLAGLTPGGLRTSVTESWGKLDFSIANRSDVDRQARVLTFFDGRPDVQYGREVWVPARSTVQSWLLAGPAPSPAKGTAAEVQALVYDVTGATGRLVLPPTEERIRSRGVLYRKRETFTALVLAPDLTEWQPGDLPRPESAGAEADALVHSFREVRALSEFVQVIDPGYLPPVPEAFDGIDHLVLADGLKDESPAGVEALRHWLQQGGRLWVMLDRVAPEEVAPVLGESLDFELVGRVSLTETRLVGGPDLPSGPAQRHERPVELARVLLPAGEEVQHTVDGWPAWFTRRVGRGTVLFTTVGPRAWYRPRTRTDPASPFPTFAKLPVALEPFVIASEALHATARQAEYPLEALREALVEEIGYSVVSRETVLWAFGGFLAAGLALGLAARRTRRPELGGWLVSVAALGGAAVFVALGEQSRRAAPPTVAVAQVVEADAGTGEAAVHGLLALYRPDSGSADVGGHSGGFFELDMSGLEGQTRRFLLTDLGSWRWENLSLPAGVRFAPLRYTTPTSEAITAVARFGPDGLEGRITAGRFTELEDALISPPEGRNVAAVLAADGALRAGPAEALPPGQFLQGGLLSDRQQRRQEIYRGIVRRGEKGALDARTFALAWARPADLPLALAPGTREVGTSLLVLPLRLERPARGERVTIPGPFIPCRRLVEGKLTRLTREFEQGTDMDLRFHLPAEVLPLHVERARVVAKLRAPSRTVTVSGTVDGKLVELYKRQSPAEHFEVELTDERMLRADAEGALHLHLAISDPAGMGAEAGVPARSNELWLIEYLELEVVGRTAPE